MVLEKRGVASDADLDSPVTNSNRYVLADMTSFFTLLVGIYFPSVTGQQHIKQQVPLIVNVMCVVLNTQIIRAEVKATETHH